MPRSSLESSFQRLWLGFLGARVLVALALLALQVAGGLLQQPADLRLLLLCSLYLVVTLATRWLASPKPTTHNTRPPLVTNSPCSFSLLPAWNTLPC